MHMCVFPLFIPTGGESNEQHEGFENQANKVLDQQ